MTTSPLILQTDGLAVSYPVRGGLFYKETGRVHALNGVSFRIRAGETLGIVGESGCGKSTLAKALLLLEEPTEGRILFDGQIVDGKDAQKTRQWRKDMRIVLQDPYESLNPKHSIRQILEEPFLVTDGKRRRDLEGTLLQLMETVGLHGAQLDRFPHEFSGGQRQRIGIARAIATNPRLVVLDEPVSALDVSIQAQIINLLLELQRSCNLTYVFIAHDLAVVRHVSDQIAVMYLGNIVEMGNADEVCANPLHPYTRALLDAVPKLDQNLTSASVRARGEVPSSLNLPKGCAFQSRCPIATERCRVERPLLINGSSDRHVACHNT
jgi:oligopeptide transport system ATP-binding protein